MRKKLKILLVLILILVLIVGGFALGVYLRLFDTKELNEEYKLHELPVVGEYFVPPAENEEESSQSSSASTSTTSTATKPKKVPESVKITKEEIEKQQKERETAEKKRITKLARLYNDMKPADAAKVMASLDINLCIAILQRMDEGNAAKVLTEFEPDRAAQITQIMYEGAPRRAAARRNAPVPGEAEESAVPGEAQSAPPEQ